MIIVQNPPSMIGNRKSPSPNSRVSSEDSFGSRSLSNLRDRTKTNLCLTDLEPRKLCSHSSGFDSSTRPRASTSEPLQSTPTPTQILFPKHVTEEQEAYARGFAQALEEIYRQQGPPASSGTPLSQVFEKITDPQVSHFQQTNMAPNLCLIDSKPSDFTRSQTDHKQSSFNQQIYEPPFVPVSKYPTMIQNTWQASQPQNTCTSSNFTNLTPSQMFISASHDDFVDNQVVQSLPATSFPSGQKRNLSRMTSQSLSNLNTTSIGSPCGSDITLHSKSLTGEFAALDMEEQEKLRLERKRAKNRVAAQKCQMKKVERIHHLENRVTYLKSKNSSLSTKVNLLKKDVDQLKSIITLHVSRGCRILSSSAYDTSDVLSLLT